MPPQTGQIGPQLNASGTGGAGNGTTQRSTKETRAEEKVVTPRFSHYNEAENAGLCQREEDLTATLPKL